MWYANPAMGINKKKIRPAPDTKILKRKLYVDLQGNSINNAYLGGLFRADYCCLRGWFSGRQCRFGYRLNSGHYRLEAIAPRWT